jgi:hypothetical protein
MKIYLAFLDFKSKLYTNKESSVDKMSCLNYLREDILLEFKSEKHEVIRFFFRQGIKLIGKSQA